MTTAIEDTIIAHRHQWSLTPLVGKRPILLGWQRRPVEGSQAVRAWLERGELVDVWSHAGTIPDGPRNVGVRCGSLIVIDADLQKPGAPQALAALDLPETVGVQTGGGGQHFYFRCPEGVEVGCYAWDPRSGDGRLGPGIDVRGRGGQAVFPGSVHPDTGEVYSWLLHPDTVPLAELPAGIVERMEKPQENPVISSGNGVHAQPLVRARAWLAKRDPAIEGAGGDLWTFKTAAALVRDFALSEDVALELLEPWNQTCSPPWTPRELAEKVRSAARNGKAPSGRLLAVPLVADTDDERPAGGERAARRGAITLRDGYLHETLPQIEQEIPRGTVFQRGGKIVRICREPEMSIVSGVTRPSNAIMIRAESSTSLAVELGRLMTFERFNGRSKKMNRIDCPTPVAHAFLEARSWPSLPALAGVVTAPTLRADGSLLDTPGFDERSSLWGEFDPDGWDIPAEPSRADAEAALARLEQPMAEFPFQGDSDRSAALSAILTGLVRRSMKSAPMHLIQSTTRGSGKTLLAQFVATIVTGHPGTTITMGSGDEWGKRVFTVLTSGDPVIIVDNIEDPLEGQEICTILTTEHYSSRKFGKNDESLRVPSQSLWMATGNNVVVRGDMTRRVILCDLDPEMERPELRSGFQIGDLLGWARKNRKSLVRDGLTVLLAFVNAGRPGGRSLGSFETWSELVRSALIWLGREDPLKGTEKLEESDPVRNAMRDFVDGVASIYGGQPWTVKQIITRCRLDSSEAEVNSMPGDEADLRESLTELCPGRDVARSLGRHLRFNKGRVFGSRRLVVSRESKKKGNSWQIDTIQDVEGGGQGGQGGSEKTKREVMSVALPIDRWNVTPSDPLDPPVMNYHDEEDVF